jgi:uncharacterized protein (TIGR01777 family)
MTQRIVIPGGSGQVGTLLARHFHAQGHQVTVLSRSPQPAPWKTLPWDAKSEGPHNEKWIAELEGADTVINLTGRSVNCRYGPANRKAIYDSRIDSTRLLNRVIASLSQPPKLWMNASTATIYRHSPNDSGREPANDEATGILGGDEAGAPDTWNFSIKVAKDWESAFFETQIPGVRKIALRSAVTFSADKGSVFEVLSNLVRSGLGGLNGNGQQMVSWIHEADFRAAIDFLIAQEDLAGVVNLASPNPLRNRDFMRALRQAWGVPIGLPAPAWLIEIGCFLLRTESELVLKSRYVTPGRLQAAGFNFRYADWNVAAIDLVGQWRQTLGLKKDRKPKYTWS